MEGVSVIGLRDVGQQGRQDRDSPLRFGGGGGVEICASATMTGLPFALQLLKRVGRIQRGQGEINDLL